MNAPTVPYARERHSALLPALLEYAPAMNFFRFCELMELAAPERPALGSTDSPGDDPVRFRSRAQLGFAPREIHAVEYDEDHPAAAPAIRTTFLGLYGVDARMPPYFIDEIAQNIEGAECAAAFLDLFHHRIVTQFYRVWRKYRYPVGFRSKGMDEVSRYLLSFAGLGIGKPAAIGAVGARNLLAMLGLASQPTRTAEGLAGVLQCVLPHARIAVQEFHPLWVMLADALPTPLGQGCVLGRGFYDRTNTVRVTIAVDAADAVLGLVPGQALRGQLMAVLQFYLGYQAQVQLEMRVAAALMPLPALHAPQVRLGYTAWLPAPAGSAAQRSTLKVRLGRWSGAGARHESCTAYSSHLDTSL